MQLTLTHCPTNIVYSLKKMKESMHSRETDRVIVEQQSRLVDVSGAYCDSKELLTLVQQNNMCIKESHRGIISFVLNKDSQLKRVEREQKI